MTHIWIVGNTVRRLTLAPTDKMAVADGQSVICAEDWAVLCAEAGGEAALLASLGLVEVVNAIS